MEKEHLELINHQTVQVSYLSVNIVPIYYVFKPKLSWHTTYTCSVRGTAWALALRTHNGTHSLSSGGENF